MEAKITLYAAGILHLAPEATIHESFRLSVAQPQIKFFHFFGLHAFIQSYMNRFLVSAGRKVYISFVPFAFLVYDPDNKSFMFNNVCPDLKTINLDIHENRRETENQMDENNEISLPTKHLSFDLSDLSFHLPEQSFNSPDLNFNPSEQGFHSPEQSFNPLEQSFHSVDLSFNPLEQGFNPLKQSFHSPDLSFNSTGQSFNPSEQRFHLPDLSFRSVEQSFHSPEQSFNPEDLHFRNLNPGSKKQNTNLLNVQAWNLSSPDVLTIYREEEDPETIRMPNGGQHAGLRESIQHWKR